VALRDVVEREVTDVMYRGPVGWFDYLSDRVNRGCPTSDEVAQFTEAKATRDVLAHNRGIVNGLYRLRAGKLARFPEGIRLDVPEPYHRATWELLKRMVSDLAGAAIAKARTP
jgi:hypothetical protein